MKINELVIFTNQIENQRRFYQDVLEFDLVYNSEEKITFKTGDGFLSFEYKVTNNPAHFAFNIASNKIEDALIWLQKRVAILPDGENVISNFKNWNARAIYFYDADNNIVEFIARRDLNINSNMAFSPKQIISISEVALVTTNISSLYRVISKIKPISVYDGGFDKFCALGNQNGLFILIDKTVKSWHPTGEEAHTADFVLKGDYNLSFIDGKIFTT